MYFDVQIALIFYMVGNEQSASCFVWIQSEIVQATTLCIRACLCGCDVICVDHDLNRCSGWWYECDVNVNSVGERTRSCGTPVLN